MDREKTVALILGTIYPSTPLEDFTCKFFYGNDYSLWGILEQAFDSKAESTIDRLSFEKSPQKIEKVLKKYNIAISDTILETIRFPEAAASADDFIDSATVYNKFLINAIKNSKIKTIFFTSMRARIIFTSKIYSPYIRELKDSSKKLTVDLPLVIGSVSKFFTGDTFTISASSIFGREIDCILLPSPSQSGGRGNPKRFQEARENNSDLDYNTWRICYYRKAFYSVFNTQ